MDSTLQGRCAGEGAAATRGGSPSLRGGGAPPLSLRDEYILKRAKALFVAAFPKRVHSTRSVSGWLRAPYVSDEESNDDLGGFPEHRDSPMPSPLRAGKKHASTPKSRSKGKKSRDGGSS